MQSQGLFCRQCQSQLVHTLQGLQCPFCESAVPYVNQAPAPYQASQPLPQYTVVCTNCGNGTSDSQSPCAHCGWSPQGYTGQWVCNQCGQECSSGPDHHSCPYSPATPTPAGTNCWKCSCGYEYNLTSKCLSCGVMNPAGRPTSKYQTVTVQCKLILNGAYWVCEDCGYDRNLTRFTQCKVCKAPNAIWNQLRSLSH